MTRRGIHHPHFQTAAILGAVYVIDINDPADELDGLMLVIAIDAANCTQGAS